MNVYQKFSKSRGMLTCLKKVKLASLAAAQREAESMGRRHPNYLYTGYHCSNCDQFHVGRDGLTNHLYWEQLCSAGSEASISG